MRINRENLISLLDAISPLDGRYREKVEDLSPYVSEGALIRTRLEIETKYLVALSNVGVVRPLSKEEKQTLYSFSQDATREQIFRVKEVEEETRHDVKAMERALREVLAQTSLEDTLEMVHFGLTSEDINNLAHRLMLTRATQDICVPALDAVVDKLIEDAIEFKDMPMLARTHGQAAVPTTLGKEIANFAIRLNNQVRLLEKMKLTGKINGAVGNYNALEFVTPQVDWIRFSENFVASLGLTPNLFTTQINPYDDITETFQIYKRINLIMLDIDLDMWRYISDDWFIQEVRKGEVGSSVMPQKVNPIDFENSEGNIAIANGLLTAMETKLPGSRLQRDLSDSTTMRNMGAALGHSLLQCRSTLAGLKRISPNKQVIASRLDENWTILAEGVQTLLRLEGVEDPYSLIANLTKGKRIDASSWKHWVKELKVSNHIKKKLFALTPQTYIGKATELTDMAVEVIKTSRAQNTI